MVVITSTYRVVGHDLGPLIFQKICSRVAPSMAGGLQRAVHVAQGRHIQHDGLADGGGEQDHDDAPDGGAGVAPSQSQPTVPKIWFSRPL